MLLLLFDYAKLNTLNQTHLLVNITGSNQPIPNLITQKFQTDNANTLKAVVMFLLATGDRRSDYYRYRDIEAREEIFGFLLGVGLSPNTCPFGLRASKLLK